MPIAPTKDQIQALLDSDLEAPVVMLNLLKFAERAGGDGVEAAPPWGSVARAYQLSRRSSVKDPRTGVIHPQPRAVFAGDIDRFIAGYLEKRRAS